MNEQDKNVLFEVFKKNQIDCIFETVLDSWYSENLNQENKEHNILTINTLMKCVAEEIEKLNNLQLTLMELLDKNLEK